MGCCGTKETSVLTWYPEDTKTETYCCCFKRTKNQGDYQFFHSEDDYWLPIKK